MIKLLAIDTSSSASSVALSVADKSVFVHKIMPMQQAQLTLKIIEELLLSQNIKINQLDAIAFGCGPGSFTGIRIATGIVQGLAFAYDIPVIPVSSLAAIAQSAFEERDWRKCLVAVDARVKEVYWGQYEINSYGIATLIGSEEVIAPDKMIFPKESDWYGVGNAWSVYEKEMAYMPLEIDSKREPSASALLSLAKIKYQNKEWVSAKDARPSYVRDQVATKAE